MNNVSLFIYLHCYGPVYANVTPKLGTAHVTAFQELVVYIGVVGNGGERSGEGEIELF